MPRQCVLTLDESFTRARKEWSPETDDDIGSLLKSLADDPYFVPDQDTYVFEQDLQHSFSACQSIHGWDGWKVVWAYEQNANSITHPVEKLIILAERSDYRRLTPKLTPG